MNDNSLLYEIIEEEIRRFELNGEKIGLKIFWKQFLCAVLFVAGTVLAFFVSVVLGLFCSWFCIKYITNCGKVKAIAKLAKANPNTPIEEIIRGTVK